MTTLARTIPFRPDPHDPTFRGDPTYYMFDRLYEDRAHEIVSVRAVIRLDDTYSMTPEHLAKTTDRLTREFTQTYMCAPEAVRTEYWSPSWDNRNRCTIPSRMTTPDNADRIVIRAYGHQPTTPDADTDPTWRLLTDHRCIPVTYGPGRRTGYTCSCGFDQNRDHPPATMDRWRLHLHQILTGTN